MTFNFKFFKKQKSKHLLFAFLLFTIPVRTGNSQRGFGMALNGKYVTIPMGRTL
jgi:hypothetical protein